MKSFNERLTDIAELTECNAHTEAYIQGCELLEDLHDCYVSDIKQKLMRIDIETARVGHLTNRQNELRYILYKKMMHAAKCALNEEELHKFRMAF